MYLLGKLRQAKINVGVNLLISAKKILDCKKAREVLFDFGLNERQIIFVPQKFTEQPTTKQDAEVAVRDFFQSTSCLLECKPSPRFVSISYDKRVGFCSYNPSRERLETLCFEGIISALEKIKFERFWL